ncbi:MAG: carboxyl transferase domain-containing protein [Candidatus Aminicenantales bacterium]
MTRVVAEYKARLATVREGGPAKNRELHKSRGKLLVRERLEKLFDPATPFLELSPLAANGQYDDEAPGAGLVTGIGVVCGREVLVVANDATVKGGTYFPMTIKKHIRAWL